ncbi:MAG: hypothetical protein ACK5O2_07055 [Microthrixaceae bacterium]
MSPLIFLALAGVVSLLGILILWVSQRTPADTPDASIEEFRSKMRALSDDPPRGRDDRNDLSRRGG